MADTTISGLPNQPILNSSALFPFSQGGSTYNINAAQFSLINTLSAEVLLVGGGASGGFWYYGGGGGGGGVLFLQNVLFLKGCSFNVGVGKGGVGTKGNNIGYSSSIQTGGRAGIDGTPSLITGTGLDLIAYGGGGGGGDNSNGDNATCSFGRPGGSGGGGSVYSYTLRPGNGIPGQGYSGGFGSDYPNVCGSAGGGGGGGGAGGVGGNGTCSVGGAGGPGRLLSITGAAVYYGAGGGGGAYSSATGGAGGTGGGGNGANFQSFNGGNATGIGAGGGGASHNENNYNPGSGADGTVIIAYPGTQKATGGTISTTSRTGHTVHTFSYPGGTFTPYSL